MLNKFSGYLPLFSAFVLVVSCIKVFLYYHNFHIPINQYIGISELIIAVAGDLLFTVPLVVGYALLGYHGERKADRILTSIEQPEDPNKIRNEKITGLIVQIFLFLGLIFLFCFLSSFTSRIYVGSVSVLFVYSFYSRYAKSQDSDYLKNEMNRTLGFSAIFLFLWLIFIAADIRNVERGKYLGTKIITKDSTYISTKEHYFIGKTENYIFIFNSNDTTTRVLRNDNVESIILKER